MKLLDQYFEIQQKIYDYFGYEDNGEITPLDDGREYFWQVADDEVIFAETKEEVKNRSGDYYASEICDQEIYRRDSYTAILVREYNYSQLLQIFDNAKEVK